MSKIKDQADALKASIEDLESARSAVITVAGEAFATLRIKANRELMETSLTEEQRAMLRDIIDTRAEAFRKASARAEKLMARAEKLMAGVLVGEVS
jgi:hypothetical protein